MDLNHPENILHALSIAKNQPIFGPLLKIYIFLNIIVAIHVTWQIVRKFICMIWPTFDEFLESKKFEAIKYVSQARVAIFAIMLKIYGTLDRSSEKGLKRKSALKWLKHWKKAENARLDVSRHGSKITPPMLDNSNGGSNHDSLDEMTGPPINIICFDSGGAKGFTILDIFSELEKRMAIPLVSLFDLAGGTAVGGVAALVGNKFPEKGKAVKKAGFMMSTIVDGSFSKRSMSKMLSEGELCEDNRATVFKHGFGDDAPIKNDQRLKAFAVASIETGSIKDGEPEIGPFLMRTYDKPEKHPDVPLADGTSSIKMWEAAEATTAAPLLWKSTELVIPQLDGDKETMKKVELCHGGIVANDPTELAVYEAMALFPDRPIGLVLSIGCGHSEGRAKKITSDLCRPDIQAMVEAMGGDYVRLNPYIGDVSTIESRGRALKVMREKVRMYMKKSYEAVRAHRLMKKHYKLIKLRNQDFDGSVASAGFTANWETASARYSAYDDDMDVSVLSMNDHMFPGSSPNFLEETTMPEYANYYGMDEESSESLKLSDIGPKNSIQPSVASSFMESTDTLFENPPASGRETQERGIGSSTSREAALAQYNLNDASASLPSIESVGSTESFEIESMTQPVKGGLGTKQSTVIPSLIVGVDSGEQPNFPVIYDRIAARSIAVIDTFDAPSLIKLLECFVRANHYDSELMEAIALRAITFIEAFDAEGLVTLVKAYVQMKHSNPDLFDAIARASVDIIDTFDAQALLGIGSSFVARNEWRTSAAR